MNVFDGTLRVDYRQFYVLSDMATDWSEPSTVGQTNGLCGASIPGLLFCTTGTHYGRVGLTVEILDGEPASEPAYEEVVEVSFMPGAETVWVQEWEGTTACSFALQRRWYRVRYSASNFQAGRDADVDPERDYEAIVDRYLLQFWPEDASRSDEIVLQTSDFANYWHTAARTSR